MKNESENQSIIERQNAFIDKRPTLATHNTDPLAVVALLQREIQEFVDAYTSEEPMEEIAREAADIIIYALTLFKTLDFEADEVEEEVNSKIARNDAKYPEHLFQDGRYVERAALAKKRWVLLGGDQAFYAKQNKAEL